MKRYYKIADLLVQMECRDRTESFARPYEVQEAEKPDIIIEPDIEGIMARIPEATESAAEYLATGDDFYKKLLCFDGMLIHSSAVIVDGKAYLFSAPCGTGKSTHVSLWRRVLGDDQVRVLNDDKPALRLEDGKWYAYGTPWSGKTGQNLNLRVPLAGIAMVSRCEYNEITPYTDKKAVQAILSQMSRVVQVEERLKQLDLVDHLMRNIPVWNLKCNISPEAAIMAYEAMSGEKYKGDWK